MTTSPTVLVEDNVRMDPSHSRADGTQRRRSAPPTTRPPDSLRTGLQSNGGGAYLRREGLSRPGSASGANKDATILTGIVRSTAARNETGSAAPDPTVATVTRTPENKLTDAERWTVLDILDSDRFVDQAPLEVYARLLDEGTYLRSVSTMYRILRGNTQVTDRRRQGPAARPGRVRNWWRPRRGRCTRGTSRSFPVRSRARISTRM